MATLIGRSGEINPTLLVLAQKAGLNLPENISVDGLNSVLQEKWVLRGKYRFQMEGTCPNDDQLALLSELDCINAIHSGSTRYNGALLMGAFTPRIRIRMDFLVREFRRGVIFKNVYLLGSHRQLDPHKEQGIIAANEMEMMKQIVYGAEVSSQWNIVSIETPNVPLVGAGYRTANTGDTFTKWRQDVKPEGKFLVVSNQPFVRYQETNARRIIGPPIQFVGIGQEADTNLPLCLFLDNLAKQFYEEKMLAGLGPV